MDLDHNRVVTAVGAAGEEDDVSLLPPHSIATLKNALRPCFSQAKSNSVTSLALFSLFLFPLSLLLLHFSSMSLSVT